MQCAMIAQWKSAGIHTELFMYKGSSTYMKWIGGGYVQYLHMNMSVYSMLWFICHTDDM